MNSSIQNIAILGTGAVGGYYGALLQQAGERVHFLLHHDFPIVRDAGLHIESPRGNIRLPKVAAYGNARDMPRCDLVIIALKTTAQAALPAILPHVLSQDGVVLTLQNGLGIEASIAAIVGAEHAILGGLCFLCASKQSPGVIRHLDYGLITLGEYRPDGQPAGLTPRLQHIGARLAHAGMEVVCIPDLEAARWRKLVWNIPFNGLSVVHNCLTDVLMQTPEIRARARCLMQEVASASAVCARPIEEAFLEKMMTHTDKMRPYAPSMKLDFEAGRPMELEAIYRAPLQMAAKAGVSMPATAALYRQLQDLQHG